MSSALKRRFNTVILPTPETLDEESHRAGMRVDSIGRSLECRRKRLRSPRSAARVTVFRELRDGRTGGRQVES